MVWIPRISTRHVLGLSLTLAAALTVVGTVALAGPSRATVSKVEVSPADGPLTSGTTLTITGTGFRTGATRNVAIVAFETAACATTAPGLLLGTSIAIISPNRLVFKVPALAAVTYNVCLYGLAGTALLGTGTYTAYARPTVAAVTPASGTVVGDLTVTIIGTGFTPKATASLGGESLTGVDVAPDGNSLTGVVPSHLAGAVNVVVTTEGGASPLLASPVAYTYANAITLVGVTTGPSSATTTIDITGVGFDGLTFDPSTGNATVALVHGLYSLAAPVNIGTDCLDIVEVSDTEIVCDVPSGLPDGAYTVTAARKDGTSIFRSVISSSATFTVADF